MAEVIRVDTSQEKHFDTSPQGSPSVQNTNQYVSVLSVNKYRFMDDAYFGTGGFRDGSYLIPHDREMFYRKRRDFSVFKNFVRPIVTALVDPVFSEQAPRIITDQTGSSDDGAPIARAFLDDVDGAGTDMQTFIQETMSTCRRHGVAFTLIDNWPIDEQPDTVQAAIDSRIYPYAIRKNAWEVIEVKTDEVGRIQEIWFAEKPRVEQTGTYERARAWTNQYSVMMERKKSDHDPAVREWHAVESPVVHGLGVLPIVVTYLAPRVSVHETLPDPPLYDIARMNHLIYNKDSEIRDLERSQAFSILYIPSDIGGNITLSSHNAILLPSGVTTVPGYISPDAAQLSGLVDNNKYYMEDLFRSAEQSGVHAVQTSREASGVALAWRFWAVDNQLKKTAHAATNCEDGIMDILSRYTNESYEYMVDYPSTFQPGDRMQEVTAYKTVVDMNPPKALKTVVFKKIANLIMSDDSDEERQEVIDAIEAENAIEDTAPEPVQKFPVNMIQDGSDGVTGMESTG